MKMHALAALVAASLAAPAAAGETAPETAREADAACVFVATRMLEAFIARTEADGLPAKPGMETAEGRAELALRHAAKMDPAACAMLAGAPDSYFAAMALQISRGD